MEFSDQALVVQVGKFKEADLWVRFLSAKRGLFTAFAFGGCRSQKRFCGCLDILNQVSIRIARSQKGGSYLNLCEGSLLAGPRRLRKDPDRLGIAINCLKFIQSFEITPESSEDAHNAACGLLTLLEEALTLPPLLPLLFRLRLAAGQGFTPHLGHCQTCGLPAETLDLWAFNPARGGIACPTCAKPGEPRLPLSRQSLEILRQIRATSPKTWEALHLPQDLRQECGEAAEDFIRYHVGVVWERNGFQRV